MAEMLDSPKPTAVPRSRQAVLDAIAWYVRTLGYPPTVRELASAVGTRSTSTVIHHVRGLEVSGYMRGVSRSPRAIQILADGEAACDEVTVEVDR